MRVAPNLFALSVAVFLLLAGCGGGDGPEQVSDSSAPGSKEAAPGVPVSKHGDNSIQTWGIEGSGAERAEVTAVVQAFLDARAARDWQAVCSSLAAKSRAEQGRIAGGTSCAKGMALLAAGASPRILADEAEIDALSFRVGGGYAFLIYRRVDGVFAMALNREAGAWKLVTATPNPLT